MVLDAFFKEFSNFLKSCQNLTYSVACFKNVFFFKAVLIKEHTLFCRFSLSLSHCKYDSRATNSIISSFVASQSVALSLSSSIAFSICKSSDF